MGHRITKTKSKIKVNKTIESKTEFFYYAFRNILLVSIPLIIISALVLRLPHSSATNSSSDHVYFTLSTSCTMSGELISPHTVEIHGGQYKTNVGTTKLNTYCNDGNGYSIYAIGSSNNIDGNTDLINSENNNYNISTGIYDSGTATVNTPSSWSMKLTAGTGSGNTLTPPTIVNGYDDYSEIPNVYTQVAKRTSETEMNTNTDVTGSYLTTTYAIYTNSYQPAGSYSGNVKYVMIHPNSNADNITGSFNMAFFKAGKSPAYQDGSGNSYFAMQDMTSDICNSVTGDGESTATQLVDIRDNKIYWVAKLADGHCWMTQNLDFDITPDTQDSAKMKTLTSEDTDLTDHSLTGAYSQANGYSYDENTGITSWIPATTAKTINFEGTTVTGWQDSNTEPYSANKTDNINTGHASLSNYYNWTAAIASNNSSTLTSNTINDISQNPQNSICPKGWRLPTISNQSDSKADSTNEFARLNYLYNNGSTDNDANMLTTPLYFVRGGNVNPREKKLNYVGVYGAYWSNTIKDGSNSYFMDLGNTEFMRPSSNLLRSFGFSIRCLAR